MLRSFKKIIAVLLVAIIAAVAFSACQLFPLGEDTPDAYTYYLKTNNYSGTKEEWVEGVVSGKIKLNDVSRLEEKEIWTGTVSDVTNAYDVFVIIDKNFAEKEFTVEDFSCYLTLVGISDVSLTEKDESGETYTVRRYLIHIAKAFSSAPGADNTNAGPGDPQKIVEAIRILEKLPFIKYAGVSPYGMAG